MSCIAINPEVVLREEFDEWAVLFNPDNGQGFGINPVSVFIWKQLDGKTSVETIVDRLKSVCDDVPAEALARVQNFIDTLVARGLAGAQG